MKKLHKYEIKDLIYVRDRLQIDCDKRISNTKSLIGNFQNSGFILKTITFTTALIGLFVLIAQYMMVKLNFEVLIFIMLLVLCVFSIGNAFLYSRNKRKLIEFIINNVIEQKTIG